MAPSAHAKLSPSGACRWMPCPGAPAAEAGKPDNSNDSSNNGTLCHALTEKCLRTGKSAKFFLGETLCVKHGKDTITGKVTQKMVDAVQVCLDFVTAYLEARPDAILHMEQEVDIGLAFGLPVDPETGRTDIWGTCDLFIVTADELVIVDWKFGFHRVEVKGNEQLSLYGIGFEHENNCFSFEKVRLVIVQPAVSDEPQEEVLGITDLRYRFEAYAPKIRAALAPNAPRCPGEKQCHFCRAAPTCPELRAETLRLAQEDFAEPEALPGDLVAEVLAKAGLIKQHIATCESFARQALEAGQPIPGWKLVMGKKNRIWLDWKGAAKTLKKLGYTEKQYLTEPEPVSPAQAEKLIGAAGKEVLAKFITTPEGEARLAPEDDPRPALAPTFEKIA